MTLDMQARIDAMTREELAKEFCYADIYSPLFLGRLGDYFIKRLKELDALDLALRQGFRFREDWRAAA
jgi:hypothetical protein